LRVVLLWGVIAYLSIHAFKDWYRSLCGLLVLMAIIERPDIPKSLLGITGLSPWNILFAVILLAWFANKDKEPKFLIPGNIKFYLGWLAFLITYSFVRMIFDYSGINSFLTYVGSENASLKGLFIDDFVNCFKYFVLSILVMLGCNSRKRFSLGMGAVLLLNLVLALQVIKWMPLSELGNGAALEQRAIRTLDREIGYFRSDLAVILAGASWAIYSVRHAMKGFFIRSFALASSLACALAVALTGGRIGMAAWVVTALMLAVFRWWRFLVFVPILLVVVITNVPSVLERFTQGMGLGDESSSEEADAYSMTSGRSEMWPKLIEGIEDNPLLGYGRRGMQNSGISQYLGEEYGIPFPHPHNAYLELVVDNGVILSIPIFIFFLVLAKYSLSLFRDSRDSLFIVAGGAGFSYVVAHLIGSIGSQSFYPTIGSVSMWCVIGMMLRVYFERKRMEEYSRKYKVPLEDLEPWGLER